MPFQDWGLPLRFGQASVGGRPNLTLASSSGCSPPYLSF